MGLLDRARHFIELEAEAVAGLRSVVDEQFARAVETLRSCRGRVVATGMGKAGLVARKIAATMASTGTPALFLHPAEASHGDLGMITSDDVALALSNSGQTEEILRIIPSFKHLRVPLISITSNGKSDLSRLSDVALVMNIEREACPLNLAPTSSTTAMMALGDALALVLLEARGLTPQDYALFHPGGSLGRRLLIKVSDLMHAGEENPVVSEHTPLSEAILVMTSRKLASTSVVGEDGRLVGFFSDGDLRRYLVKGGVDMNAPMTALMTRNPKVARPSMMAVKAFEILAEFKILELPVVDDDHRPIGMIHLHDITRAGIA
ncbi:KpsF/GutQ family sugar-phosphate isomerase [bacterium]|nr:KpsF/GutQ family sugar-phosphate isomerase [bacterium]